METAPVAKRARLSTEDVLEQLDMSFEEQERLDDFDNGPCMQGSDDELEDLQMDEREDESDTEELPTDDPPFSALSSATVSHSPSPSPSSRTLPPVLSSPPSPTVTSSTQAPDTTHHFDWRPTLQPVDVLPFE